MGSANVSELCREMQADEITVLESIYPGLIARDTSSSTSTAEGTVLRIQIPIAFPSPVNVELDCVTPEASSSAIPPSLKIEHLPPITLVLHLPISYPVSAPPKIHHIHALLPSSYAGEVSWLSRKHLLTLSSKLGLMWEEEKVVSGEGQGVLWRFWEWVGTGDFLMELNMIKSGVLRPPVPPSLAPSTYHTALKTYNATQLHSSFELTAFSCAICMENRKGKSCVRIPGCDCVFCLPCLNSCWTLAIEEGTLENVSCPSISCVKARTTKDARTRQEDSDDADPELVESVVGKALRERWQELKDRRRAEIDPTYTICPRPGCQAAVPPPEAESPITPTPTSSSRAIRLSEISTSSKPSASKPPSTLTSSVPAEDPWARYRLCPTCSYSFCLYCSATWHGPHTPCSFPQTSLIVLEYLSYPEGSEGRRNMESRRGKGNIEKMVRKWREDEENKKWLDNRTRACAGCGVRVEKSHGCNHMTCNRCSAHFCYRCGDSISPQDPYAHYRRPGHACFEKLFDQEEIERFERETAMGIVGLPNDAVEVEGAEWRDIRGFWEW